MTQIIEDWVKNGSTQRIFDVYDQHGFQLYFVGGCVRNALFGVDVSDFDLCSDAAPDAAMAFLEDAGYRVIPTGIEHGTLTVLSGGIPHEITTFRKDVSTDGRRATVAFSTSLEEDARRRDFTINALYADRTGKVLDPLNGFPDITARRVRFIEDPIQRIREDYLRILRFFRFHARFAKEPPDPETLDAIARNLDGLSQLSTERVTAEVLRILALTNPAPAVGSMDQVGVLNVILPGAQTRALAPLVHFEQLLGASADPITRLAALGDENIASVLRLSKAEKKRLQTLREAAVSTMSAGEIGFRHGEQSGLHALALRSALLETPIEPDIHKEVSLGAQARFPVKAGDLGPRFAGRQIGAELRRLEAKWIQSGFQLTKSDLLG